MKQIRTAICMLIVLAMAISMCIIDIPIVFAAEEGASDGQNVTDADGGDSVATTVDGQLCVEGEVIVKFKDKTNDPELSDTLSALNSVEGEALPLDNTVVAEVPEGESIEGFVDSLEAQPNVEYAQPNYIFTLDRTVNDPDAQMPSPKQWYLSKINAYNAWDYTMGSSGVLAAVIDTGIDLSHPEFAGRIQYQYDFADNDSTASDDYGHGTHVAGIIAAASDNGAGGTGIAPKVNLLIADVFKWWTINGEQTFGASTTHIIEGVNYAVANGADVINMSLGGIAYNATYEAAVNNAVASGVVIVAAAGNSNTNAAQYPSDYSGPISVIATDSNNNRASFSNYGDEKDISAPGVNIWNTFLSGTYANLGGTSMASPVVAGVVALMLSKNPGLTPAQVKDILYSTATDVTSTGVGWDQWTGYGVVNAAAAVSGAADLLTPPITSIAVSSPKDTVLKTHTLQMSASVLPLDADSTKIQWSVENGIGAATINSTTGVLTGTSIGTVTVRATAKDGSGVYGEKTISVTAPEAPAPAPAPAPTPAPAPAPAPAPVMVPVTANKIPTSGGVGAGYSIIPSAPKGYTMQAVSYTSNNPAVAVVDAAGNMVLVGGGKATVVIKVVSQKTDRRGRIVTKVTTVKKKITVKQLVDSISLNVSNITIAKAQKLKLTASIAPASASNKKVTWTSSNKRVATVSSSGVVTGKGAGTAEITCKARDGSGVVSTCTVTVTPIYPTGVKLSKSALSLKMGKTATLRATVAPRKTDFKTVTWTSSNPAVATVDARGRVRGMAPGTAIITATTSNGLTASCGITVQ